MSIPAMNLPFTIAQADHAHMFQSQYAVLDRSLRDAETAAEHQRANQRAHFVAQQEQKDGVDRDGGQGTRGSYRRRRDQAEDEEAPPAPRLLPPTGEGGIIDITV